MSEDTTQDVTTDTSAPAAPTAPASIAVPAAPTTWHGFTEPSDLEMVKQKGWKSNNDMLKAYRGAVTLIGRNPEDVLVRPKEGDANAWNGLYDRLGRPKEASGYDMTAGIPEGAQADERISESMREVFHKAGLSAGQAKAIAEAYNTTASGMLADREQATVAAVTADKQRLQREWGGGFERQMTSAKAAVSALGFSKEEINALQDTIGYHGVMTKFAELGKRLSDPSFVSGNTAQGFDGLMTPAEANAEIQKIKLDDGMKKALYDKLHPAHASVAKKWKDLHAIAYPG